MNTKPPSSKLNALRSIGIIGAIGALAGIGKQSVTSFIDSAIAKVRKKDGAMGPRYRGCRKDKFAHMSRQRVRAEARKIITKAVRSNFALPRRICRAIIRTRANREWREYGKVESALPQILKRNVRLKAMAQ